MRSIRSSARPEIMPEIHSNALRLLPQEDHTYVAHKLHLKKRHTLHTENTVSALLKRKVWLSNKLLTTLASSQLNDDALLIKLSSPCDAFMTKTYTFPAFEKAAYAQCRRDLISIGYKQVLHDISAVV